MKNLLNSVDDDRLKDYIGKAFERYKYFIGYPIAQDFDYAELYPLLKLPLNNVGDPFIESMWYAIKKRGLGGMRQRALDCLELAEFTVDKFQAAGIRAWRNPSAITVVFPEPSIDLRQKWQIATENGFSHIIRMPGVSKALISQFIDELKTEKNRIGSMDWKPAPL